MKSDVPKQRIVAIFAMASNRVIGKNGDIPWRLSEDWKLFKKITLGHPVVMGRRTMESLPKRLAGRRSVVISRAMTGAPEGYEWVSNCDEAIELLQGEEKVFIIGGAQIFTEMLPVCDEVLLSYVFHPYEGDTYLPEFEDDFKMKEILYQDDDFELRRYVRDADFPERLPALS